MLPSLLSYFSLGLLLGWVGGVFGIGGGLIAIPVLGWIFGMEQQLAQGTALLMVAPNVILGFWRYKQRNPIDLQAALLLAGSSILSTFITAQFAAGLQAHALRMAFACFLIGLALYLIIELRPRRAARTPRRVLGQHWLAGLGLVSGAFSGIFTVGGGLVVAPVLVKFFGIARQTTAQGLALATVTPSAVIALLTYARAGQVNWTIGLPLAAGGLFGISWGVHLAHRLPERRLRALFSLLLLLAAGMLF